MQPAVPHHPGPGHQQKEKIARQMAERVRSGDVIGVGSGSTSLLALQAIAARMKQEKLACTAIPTSHEIALACADLGVPVTSLMSRVPDWGFDGADEVDPAKNLIKGRGGAMFREKLVMKASPKTYILADSSKFVDRLGTRFPVPVEVYPEALRRVEKDLQALDTTEVTLRLCQGGKDGPVITEQGNVILDVKFRDIGPGLEREIKALAGVLDSGLFQDWPVEIVSG
ncbi:MAG: ribose 5-phosphate isomerase A [Pseudomonadota bacterium]|nr:ribose 5-phosphate isomerase A [Pseudomonadota bacterium]